MGELEIREHDFNDAKLKIKEFSEQTPTDLSLEKVATTKRPGEWFVDFLKGGGVDTEHVVKGHELNELTSQIQKHIIEINKVHKKIIGEFGQVYNALEGLDKGYIQAIVTSIKATERTSEKLNCTQEKLQQSVNGQKKTLEVLDNFKKKMEGFAHLDDIDKIWTAYETWHRDLLSLTQSIGEITSITEENAQKLNDIATRLTNTDNEISELTIAINEQITKLESVIAFIAELEGISHLQDIDSMWDCLEDARNTLNLLSEELNSEKEAIIEHQASIDVLIRFMDSVSPQIHLQDIDELWESNQDHSTQLAELHKQNSQTIHLIQTHKEANDSSITELAKKNDDAVQVLMQKIKYAYLIAGGSLSLALIELIILLMKVI